MLNKKTDGIINASVNFASERLSVRYASSVTDDDMIAKAVEKAGFTIFALNDSKNVTEDDPEKVARLKESMDQRKNSLQELFLLFRFLY